MAQIVTPEINWQAVAEQPTEFPFLEEFFMVSGGGYRGMAYQDKDGRWRKARTHEEIRGDVLVLE